MREGQEMIEFNIRHWRTLAITLGTIMIALSISTRLSPVEGWYKSKCYKYLSGESEGYLYFKGGLIWEATHFDGNVRGTNIGWYRNFKGRQYEAFFWDLYGPTLSKTQAVHQVYYSKASTRLLVQIGCRGIKVLERTGKRETDFMETFSPRAFSPVKNDKLLTFKLSKQTGRILFDEQEGGDWDRDAPCGAPLPDHRTYGSRIRRLGW
jgi:hypothetical protein